MSGVKTAGWSHQEAAEKAGDANFLREYGVKADAFAQYKVEISEAALHDGCTSTNPRVPTAEELLKVLEKAF